MGINKVYGNAEPVFNETHTGADLLVVRGGFELLGGAGCKLVWIQSKRTRSKKAAWSLRYGQHNRLYGTQCAALNRLHEPDKGSWAMYMQYSPHLSLIPSVSTTHLSERGKRVDLGELGIRLQEHLLDTACNESGRFASARDVLKFVRAKTTSRTDLPLHAVAVDARGSQLARSVVRQLVELDRELSPNPDRSRGHGSKP